MSFPPRREPFDGPTGQSASFYRGCATWARRMISAHIWALRNLRAGPLDKHPMPIARHRHAVREHRAWVRWYRRYHTAAIARANKERE